jgi:hypothetical protein
VLSDERSRPTTPTDRVIRLPPLRRSDRRRSAQTNVPVWRFAVVLAALATVGVFVLGISRGRATYVGFVLVPILALALYPLIKRLAAEETAFDLVGIAYCGLFLRFISSYFRWQGAADAIGYHNVGVRLSRSFRQLQFDVDTGREIPGTGTVRYLSGLVSVVSGTDIFAKFLIFTVLAFLGTLLFYAAFRRAIPDGDRKRYALLIFLWPSFAYWPSSIGKESVLVFSLGLVAYGAAGAFTNRAGGLPVLAAGLFGVVMVRPHVGLIALVAVITAYVFVRGTGGSRVLSLTKITVITLLLLGGSIIATRTAEFLNLENLSTDTVSSARIDTEQQTTQGGGAFVPVRADTPAGFPAAIGTVLFRPFPCEAGNNNAALTGVEGTFLIVLLGLSWRRLARIPKLILTTPYVAFAASMILVFCYAFSVIGNFGILARQRSQLLPFLFVFLALPLVTRAADRRPSRVLTVGRPEVTEPAPPADATPANAP